MDKLGNEKHSLSDPRVCCPGMTGRGALPDFLQQGYG